MAVVVSFLAWLAALGLAGWSVIRGLGLERGYPLVPLMAFTPYVMVLGALVVIALGALRRRGPWALALASTLLMAVSVLPRAVDTAQDGAAPASALRVMTANVAFGRVPPETIVGLVRRYRIDVLSLQELTPELARALGRAGLHDLLPSRVVEARGGAQGTGLYARMRLEPMPRLEGTVHAQARAAFRWRGIGRVELVAVHPPPPIRSQLSLWRRDLRDLPRPSRGGGTSRILAGDFNATLDHHELRRLLDAGYEDAAARTGDGWRMTWNGESRFGPTVAIDHVLTDRRWRAQQVDVVTVPRSDHRAVIAELALRPALRPTSARRAAAGRPRSAR